MENKSLRAVPSSSGSVTSPSRKTPAGSGAIPNFPTAAWPLTATSAAATLPASTSRPTMALLFLFESIRTVVVGTSPRP